jgi:ATP-binding protein involved in chromosome partitioning
MDRDAILNVLKTVNYPGFSRDIVSFGMIEEIIVEDSVINIRLAVASDNDEQKSKLSDVVGNALTEKFPSAKVQISVVQPKASNEGPATKAPGVTAVASPIPGIKHTIAVASGKGGVGKSTVSVNLAMGLAASGAKVGILDLDIYGPSLPMIMGTDERPYVNKEQKIVPLEQHGIKIMSFGFISGNQAPTIWRGPMVAKMTEQFFNDVEWGELDYLILDLPPGTGDVQLTLTQQLNITGALIVTTPQDIALADVRKGADMFRKVNAPVLGVVENMSGLIIEGKIIASDGKPAQVKIDVIGEKPVVSDKDGKFSIRYDIFKRGGGEAESKRLGVSLLGVIPISGEIVDSTDSGKPIVLSNPQSPISKIYTSIAEKIMENLN